MIGTLFETGAARLEILIALALALAVMAGWLLHALWSVLGPVRALRREVAAQAGEAAAWRAEAERLAHRLEAQTAAPRDPEDAPDERSGDDDMPGHDKPGGVG